MVRSLWLRTLAASLVWTGAVWAQQPAQPADNSATDQILTIQESGKRPQKCKVVQSWRTTDGLQAYQVRSLDTGEMMTITEKAATPGAYGAKPQGIAMQVYHWGSMHISPPKVPAPEKPAPVSGYGANSPATASPSSSYTSSVSSSRSVAATSSYTLPSSSAAPAAAEATKQISLPAPEKDWRQSWTRADDRPLRIEDKPSTRDSIADAPQLKIESKPVLKDLDLNLPPVKNDLPIPAKEAKLVVPKQEPRPSSKQIQIEPKIALDKDDPLLHPDRFMPKSIDITPTKKAPYHTEDKESIVLEKSKTQNKLPEPAPAHIPTIANLAAGMKTETKTPPAVPMLPTIANNSKPITLENLPLSPAPVAPKPQVSSDSSKAILTEKVQSLPALPVPAKAGAATDSNKVVGVDKSAAPLAPPVAPKSTAITSSGKVVFAEDWPTVPAPRKEAKGPADDAMKSAADASKSPVPIKLPSIPEFPLPVTAPAPAVMAEKKAAPTDPGHASASSMPVIPLITPVPAAPPAPISIAVQNKSKPASANEPPIRSERPNFLVLEPARSESQSGSINLPGQPNAVIAFGQPVTVTAPPPDMIRKKSLEAHSIQVMVGHLETSLYPSQREWAAEGLTSANWKVHPEVVTTLCKTAVADPAPTVRARCIHTLAVMDVRTDKVLEAVHKLQADPDESVRSQAEEALKMLEATELPRE